MLQQAYGEDCFSRMQCQEWHKRFKSGRTSIKDDPKSGWTSTSMDDDHVEKVLAVIRQKTVHEGEEEVGQSSCHLILTENSPDLAPADLFLKWKPSLKGRRFQTVEEIEENSIQDLRAIPQNMFQKWKKREQCIKSGGEYFEDDKFD